jgi:hypothetical protein
LDHKRSAYTSQSQFGYSVECRSSALLGQPVAVPGPQCSAAFWVADDSNCFGRNFARGGAVMRVKLSAQSPTRAPGVFLMDGIIYLVGLIVIVMFILSFLGLH